MSKMILYLEFVMKKTCPFDFYLIDFPFFENYFIFTHLFDFVCNVGVHGPLEAQQVAHFIRLK